MEREGEIETAKQWKREMGQTEKERVNQSKRGIYKKRTGEGGRDRMREREREREREGGVEGEKERERQR